MSKRPAFPVRLATKRHEGGASEWIEQAQNGVLFWKCEEPHGGASFPCGVGAAAEYFKEWGREFDAAKLPLAPVADPYSMSTAPAPMGGM